MSYIITPAKKVVLIKPISLSQIGGGVLDVAIASDKKQEVGEVISIGLGTPPVKMKKGDLVAYRVFGGTKFLIGGEELIFASFADLLGVITKHGV